MHFKKNGFVVLPLILILAVSTTIAFVVYKNKVSKKTNESTNQVNLEIKPSGSPSTSPIGSGLKKKSTTQPTLKPTDSPSINQNTSQNSNVSSNSTPAPTTKVMVPTPTPTYQPTSPPSNTNTPNPTLSGNVTVSTTNVNVTLSRSNGGSFIYGPGFSINNGTSGQIGFCLLGDGNQGRGFKTASGGMNKGQTLNIETYINADYYPNGVYTGYNTLKYAIGSNCPDGITVGVINYTINLVDWFCGG